MNLIKHIYLSVEHFNSSLYKTRLAKVVDAIIIGIYFMMAKNKLRSRNLHNFSGLFTIHSLVSHYDLPFYFIGISSFIIHLSNNPRLIIYDDGTLTEDDYQQLKSIPNSHIIKPLAAKRKAGSVYGITNKLMKYRESSPFNRKLIDIAIYKNISRRILILDSDIVFFRKPDVLINFLTSDSLDDLIYIRDMQNAYVAPVRLLNRIFKTKCVTKLNSGILAMNSSSLTTRFVIKYYESIALLFLRMNIFTPWIEQTAYAILASLVKARPLPREYAIDNEYSRKQICKHYVHSARANYTSDIIRSGLLLNLL